MCGRFSLTQPDDAMARLFAASPANNLPRLPNYNICPTNPIHVIKAEGAARQLVAMRWGFLPHWYDSETAGPLLINARAETLARKPAFAEACRARRCLIPASGFYEWTKDSAGKRLPWYIQAADQTPLAFAGIWQSWGQEAQKTCAIVTTAANQTLGAIHHRMPLVLAPQDWPLWLGEAGKGAATLMQPGPEEHLQMHRVSPRVNSNRATGPELIEPFFEEGYHDDTDVASAQQEEALHEEAAAEETAAPRLI